MAENLLMGPHAMALSWKINVVKFITIDFWQRVATLCPKNSGTQPPNPPNAFVVQNRAL